MTQNEIIEMANKVGCKSYSPPPTRSVAGVSMTFAQVEELIKLVAAKEREKLKNVAIFDRWYQELDAAVLAEREACAKLIADPYFGEQGKECAKAIRARGEA